MRERNVSLLGRLVPTDKQDDEFCTALRVIHTVARADINLQFGNAFREVAMLPRVSMGQAIKCELLRLGPSVH